MNTTSLPRIALLSDTLSNQIAAGEVVERPGSVIKELVENSLDAGATEIRVAIKEGGVRLIEIADNGHGIHPDDFHLALDRHATSKIKAKDDLFAIRSWGFRGEALASIGSVSRLHLLSRRTDFPHGQEILMEGGTTLHKREIPRPIGTTVKVEELFFNTPARRKFLKSQAAETSYCLQVIQRLALSSPQTMFEFSVDGNRVYHFPQAKNHEERVAQVYREAFKLDLNPEEIIKIKNDKPDAQLEAYLLPTRYNIPSSRGIFTFVNKRSVKDRLLQQAITTAAQEVLFGQQYPQVVLFLHTAPENVDVNVHPAKSEVRFRNANQIFGLIRASLERALAAAKPVESFSFANSPSPAAMNEQPKEQMLFESPAHFHQKTVPSPYPEVSPTAETPPRTSGPQFLGTLKNTYLVCQDAEGLLLVDQHAAHERVTYERLRRSQGERWESMPLLIPIQVEIQQNALNLLEQHFDALAESGLVLDRSGPSQIAVREIPTLLLDGSGNPRLPLSQLIKNLANHLEDEMPPGGLVNVLQKVLLETLASQSCHGSVRAGQSLSSWEADALLRQMSETDFAGHCPHGRPTTVRIKWPELERMFKRLV